MRPNEIEKLKMDRKQNIFIQQLYTDMLVDFEIEPQLNSGANDDIF